MSKKSKKQQEQRQRQKQIVNIRIGSLEPTKSKRKRPRRKPRKTPEELQYETALLDYMTPRQMPTIVYQTGFGFQPIQGTPTPSMSSQSITIPSTSIPEFQDVGVGTEGFVKILEKPSKRETLEMLTEPVAKVPEIEQPIIRIPSEQQPIRMPEVEQPIIFPKQPSSEGIMEAPIMPPLIETLPNMYEAMAVPKSFREMAMEETPVIIQSKIPNLESEMFVSMPELKPEKEPKTLESVIDMGKEELKKLRARMYYQQNREAILSKRREKYAMKQTELKFTKPKTIGEDIPAPVRAKKVVKSKAVPFYT